MNKHFKHISAASLMLLAVNFAFAQNVGSALLFDSFYQSQLYNPAYFANPDYPTIGLPVLGSVSLTNNANFKLSSFVLENPESGKMEFRFDDFDSNPDKLYMQLNIAELPVLYFNIKIKGKNIGFYYKESFYGLAKAKGKAFTLFNNGNTLAPFKDVSSEPVNVSGISFREFAANFTNNLSDRLTIGYRPKLVFGVTNIFTDDFQYNIRTSTHGDSIALTSFGSGRISVPFEVKRDEEIIYRIEGDNIYSDYFGAFGNPGLAIDLGFTYRLSQQSNLSFSLLNMGFIRFKSDSYELGFNKTYVYRGLNVNPAESSADHVQSVKKELQNAIRPDGKFKDYTQMLPITVILHYDREINPYIKLGATNQLLLLNQHTYNTTTLSSKFSFSIFDIVGNANFFNFKAITIGGGLALHTKYVQLFFLANNLSGLYHSAANENFSLNLGVQITINPESNSLRLKKKESEKAALGGKTSKYFPFYKDLK